MRQKKATGEKKYRKCVICCSWGMRKRTTCHECTETMRRINEAHNWNATPYAKTVHRVSGIDLHDVRAMGAGANCE